MATWKDIADDMVNIYILLFASLLIILGAEFFILIAYLMTIEGAIAIAYSVCPIMLIMPGAVLIWIMLQRKYWFKKEPKERYERMYPFAKYPPPQTTQTDEEYRSYIKSLYRKLHVPSFKKILIVFLIAVAIGAGVLLTIDTWFSTFAAVPFLIVFIIAFSFPSLMWISFVYRKDVFTPEPARNMMTILTWGMLSVILALIAQSIFGSIFAAYGLSAGAMTFLAAVVIAPFGEELFKPLGLHLIRLDINTKLDALIYGVTAGMGFAMVENLTYEMGFLAIPIIAPMVDIPDVDNIAIFASTSFAELSLARGLGSTVGHAVGAGMIGMGYFTWRKSGKTNIFPLIGAYCLAVTLHMTWNGTLTVMEIFDAHLAFFYVFVATFPLLEIFILIQLIRISKREEPVPIEGLKEKPIVHPVPPQPPMMPAAAVPQPYYPPQPYPTYPSYPIYPSYPASQPYPTYPAAEGPALEIDMTCPSCKSTFPTTPPQHGKEVACPFCDSVFTYEG